MLELIGLLIAGAIALWLSNKQTPAGGSTTILQGDGSAPPAPDPQGDTTVWDPSDLFAPPAPPAVVPPPVAPPVPAPPGKTPPAPSGNVYPPVPDRNPSFFTGSEADIQTVKAMAGHVAQQFGIDPTYFIAVVKAESAFNPNAVSPTDAYGLAQVEPDTAAAMGYSMRDLQSSIYDQLVAGATYLSQQLKQFGGSMVGAAEAYNAGPGRVQQYGIGNVPFAETRAYVQAIRNTVEQQGGTWVP